MTTLRAGYAPHLSCLAVLSRVIAAAPSGWAWWPLGTGASHIHALFRRDVGVGHRYATLCALAGVNATDVRAAAAQLPVRQTLRGWGNGE